MLCLFLMIYYLLTSSTLRNMSSESRTLHTLNIQYCKHNVIF